MRYTLWSRGRLVGETDLGFVFRFGGFRCGWLHPTPLGERLMPAATGVAPALRTAWMIGPDATARADVRSAVDQEEALELELRGPDGAVIATEDIGVIDTHYLLAIAETGRNDDDTADDAEQDAEQDAEIEALLDRWREDGDPLDLGLTSEQTELPRYQVQVNLVDHNAVP